MDELQSVRDLYAALRTGDQARLAELLHPGLVCRTTEGLPLGLGGVYQGAEETWRQFWGRIGKSFRVHAEPQGFHPLKDGGLLVVGRYVGTARATGGKVDAAFAHLLHLTDGRISGLVQFTDSARWAQALDKNRTAEDPSSGGTVGRRLPSA